MDSSPFKLLVLLSLLVSFQVANASLDRLHGPREFVPSSSISSLTRQLLEAVLLGDFNLANVTSILTAGADPNAYDENQMTALHWAVIKGQNETVKTLLARGAYTDALDASYRTPAHFLGIYGWGGPYPSILSSLYFAGANLNAGDQAHNTALHYAAMEGQTETARNLVAYGARLDVVNLWQHRTPYGMAVLENQTETAAALLQLVASLPPAQKSIAEQEVVNDVVPCQGSSCPGRCLTDQSNLRMGGSTWGCYQNNFFMGQQPVQEPQPPGPPQPEQQLGVIQGDVVT